MIKLKYGMLLKMIKTKINKKNYIKSCNILTTIESYGQILKVRLKKLTQLI